MQKETQHIIFYSLKTVKTPYLFIKVVFKTFLSLIALFAHFIKIFSKIFTTKFIFFLKNTRNV